MKRRLTPTGDPLPGSDPVDQNTPETETENFEVENDGVSDTGSTGALPRAPTYRAPNPDIVRRDPMAEMFGPGSTLKMIGEEDDEMPEEIRGIIEEHGLSKKDFSCTLKEVPAGSTENVDTSSNSIYIKAWKRQIPSTEWIAREHGPGFYILILTWRIIDRENNVHRTKREIVNIQISDKCAAEYKKHQLDKKINDASATGTKVREAIVEKTIEGQLISAITGSRSEDKNQTPKEYLEELMSTVRTLGLPVGGFGNAAPPAKIEWDKFLPAIITGATALLGVFQQASQRRSEENNKLFMLLLSQNQNASSQMLELVKAQSGTQNNPLKELQSMVMSAMDIKEMMNPAKETLSDKIFKIVEMVAPQILNIAAAAAQNRQPPRGPAVDMAKMYVKADPDFAKLRNDPVEMEKFVRRLDDRIGWENADVVLNVVEWTRPENCVREPAKKYPPQATAEDAESDDVATVE
jgi:hypothetical protein